MGRGQSQHTAVTGLRRRWRMSDRNNDTSAVVTVGRHIPVPESELEQLLARALGDVPIMDAPTRLESGLYDQSALQEQVLVKASAADQALAQTAFVAALDRLPYRAQSASAQRFIAYLTDTHTRSPETLRATVSELGLDRVGLSHHLARVGSTLHILARPTRPRNAAEVQAAPKAYVGYGVGGRPYWKVPEQELPMHVLHDEDQADLARGSEMLCGKRLRRRPKRVAYGAWTRTPATEHCAACAAHAGRIAETAGEIARLSLDYDLATTLLHERLVAALDDEHSRGLNWKQWEAAADRLARQTEYVAIGRAVSACGDDALVGLYGVHELAVNRSLLADDDYRLVDHLQDEDWADLARMRSLINYRGYDPNHAHDPAQIMRDYLHARLGVSMSQSQFNDEFWQARLTADKPDPQFQEHYRFDRMFSAMKVGAAQRASRIEQADKAGTGIQETDRQQPRSSAATGSSEMVRKMLVATDFASLR